MENGVQRWAVNVSNWNPSEEEFQSLLVLLPFDDHLPVTRFLKRKDKIRALVSRLVQYVIVHVMLGIPFDDIVIRRTKEGKPYLANSFQHHQFPNFNFNTSHHGDYVVIACDPLCLVGIDVMSHESYQDEDVFTFLKNFKSCFTYYEWNNILNAGPSNKDVLNQFYRYWCLKEAYIKAVGIGFGFKLNRLEFYYPENKSDFAHLRIDGVEQINWSFVLHELDSYHWACVARGPPMSATCTYKQTLWKTEFTEEDYKIGFELPNKDFTFFEVEQILKIVMNAKSTVRTGSLSNKVVILYF